MAQFAVHDNKNPRTRSAVPFVVDVQSDLLDQLQTRVVIPLTRVAALKKNPLTRLTPSVRFRGESYLLMTPQLAGMPRSELGAPAGSLLDQRDVIVAAIDFLITGF